MAAIYGYELDSGSAIPVASAVTPETAALAAWNVLGLAADSAEAAEVLQALGLTPADAAIGKLLRAVR